MKPPRKGERKSPSRGSRATDRSSPAPSSRSGLPDLGASAGPRRLAVERRSQGHWPALYRHRAGVPRAGRRARDCDAAAARQAQQRSHQRRALQRDFHDAWDDDDVPVRRAGDAGNADLFDAADGRHAGHGVPAADRFFLLHVPRRRLPFMGRVRAQYRARHRLVRLPAAIGPAIWASASAPTSGRRW